MTHTAFRKKHVEGIKGNNKNKFCSFAIAKFELIWFSFVGFGWIFCVWFVYEMKRNDDAGDDEVVRNGTSVLGSFK